MLPVEIYDLWIQSLSPSPASCICIHLVPAQYYLACPPSWSLRSSPLEPAFCIVVMLCVFCLGQWSSRLFQPVQYGQKPEGRTVAFPSTHPPRMANTNTSTATPQGQVRGRPPIATFSANPDTKGISHNELSFMEDCGKAPVILILAYWVL